MADSYEEESDPLLENQEHNSLDCLFDPDKPRERRPNSSTYEEAISATGYGWFQYRLLALCGWALSSDAIEILSISFILPPATCDLKLQDSDKGIINSTIFVGMMIGGYLWGTLADIKGRRAILLWSLSVNALGGLASSFAQTFWVFLLLRIISGIGVGGSMPVIFAYYTEFQPKSRRGSMISFLATFWMCGNIVAAALAWIVIPRNLDLSSGSFSYGTWRLYLALCIIPSFTSALMYVLMPESPKFLMENGRDQEALRVLERVYKCNMGRRTSQTQYPITALAVHRSVDVTTVYDVHRGSSKKQWVKTQCSTFFKNTADLFKPPLTSVTIVMMIIMFTLSFGYYGLFMWFPELFQRIDKYGGSACSPGDTSINRNVTISNCTVSSTVYLEGFLTAVSNLPGNIFTILLIDKLGRKPLLASSMVLSGLSVFFIWFLRTQRDNLIMSCIFSGVSVVGWNALDVLNAELFPTNLRSTATGVLTGVGRIASIGGNLIFGELVTTNCAIPMILIACLMCGGGLASIKLPNSANLDLL